jgi:fructose-6-phosphate aldolase 2
MKLYLDTANIDEIKEGIEYFCIDGVTTNPAIMVKESTEFFTQIKRIVEVIGKKRKLFVQVIATDTEKIVDDAKVLAEQIDGNLYVKIPVTREGLKAIKILSGKGIKTAATSIINSQQGLLAAKAGAEYLIPYVNRADNILGDGVNTVGEMVEFIEAYGYECEVLAASFKNIQQVHNCALNHVHGVTLPLDLLNRLSSNNLTDVSVEDFTKKWLEVYPGKDNLRSMVK